MKPPILRPEAAADVEDAWAWYEGQREGLGDEFIETVQAGLDAIRSHPLSSPAIHRDTRRHLLKRFPYGPFYKLVEGQVIVVACFHAKRSPRVWRSRS